MPRCACIWPSAQSANRLTGQPSNRRTDDDTVRLRNFRVPASERASSSSIEPHAIQFSKSRRNPEESVANSVDVYLHLLHRYCIAIASLLHRYCMTRHALSRTITYSQVAWSSPDSGLEQRTREWCDAAKSPVFRIDSGSNGGLHGAPELTRKKFLPQPCVLTKAI